MLKRYETPTVHEKQYNTGLYIRLSVDDLHNSQKRKDGNPFQHESSSVENQKIILEEYVQLRGWNVTRVYTDDGFSGGNYDRPGFQEMIEDAKSGLINLIIVKDLSRLGRDYIETGRYTDEVFPLLGVRFIALMDGIDSEGNDDILPFRSILNDYHLKDLSRKIKSVLRAKAEAGTYIGAFAPYGYMKDPSCPTRLIVDEEAATVVRHMFNLRNKGDGYRKIAIQLNAEGILTAKEYWYNRIGKPNPYKSIGKWTYHTVKQILTNETYLGHSVKFRMGTLSYKNKKHIHRNQEDWIRVENTHMPIISQDVWDAVQERNQDCRDKKPRRKANNYLFSKLTFCVDCGSAMVGQSHTNKRKDGTSHISKSYICTRKRIIGECSWHFINENDLLEIVKMDIRCQLEKITINEDAVIREIQGSLASASLSEAKIKLNTLDVRLAELETLGTKLYEDRLAGVISLDVFKALSIKTDNERTQKQAERDTLHNDIEIADRQVTDIGKWINNIKNFFKLESLDNEAISSLVEKIEIGEPSCRGKNKQQDVTIHYRFVGQLR